MSQESAWIGFTPPPPMYQAIESERKFGKDRKKIVVPLPPERLDDNEKWGRKLGSYWGMSFTGKGTKLPK